MPCADWLGNEIANILAGAISLTVIELSGMSPLGPWKASKEAEVKVVASTKPAKVTVTEAMGPVVVLGVKPTTRGGVRSVGGPSRIDAWPVSAGWDTSSTEMVWLLSLKRVALKD